MQFSRKRLIYFKVNEQDKSQLERRGFQLDTQCSCQQSLHFSNYSNSHHSSSIKAVIYFDEGKFKLNVSMGYLDNQTTRNRAVSDRLTLIQKTSCAQHCNMVTKERHSGPSGMQMFWSIKKLQSDRFEGVFSFLCTRFFDLLILEIVNISADSLFAWANLICRRRYISIKNSWLILTLDWSTESI